MGTLHSHCRNGHEYTPLNSNYKPSRNGVRECVECQTLRGDRYAKAKKHKGRPGDTGWCMAGLHEWVDANLIVDKYGYARCYQCRQIAVRAFQGSTTRTPCVVRGCKGGTSRRRTGTYICPKHRKNPPSWIATLGRRIVGTEVLAA